MKKFVSMAMVAAMTVSMVPATAFAAGEASATAKIVDALEITKDEAKADPAIVDNDLTGKNTTANKWNTKVPELKLTITDVDYRTSNEETSVKEVTLTLDNAVFADVDGVGGVTPADFPAGSGLTIDMDGVYGTAVVSNVVVEDDDEITIEFTGEFMEDDVITIDLNSVLDKTGVNSYATVSVSGDLVEADDLRYVSVLGQGITATTKKIATVAEEEKTALEKDIKIKAAVGTFENGQVIQLKLNNGFEFANMRHANSTGFTVVSGSLDDNYVEIEVVGTPDELIIDAADMEIEAVDAKSGDVATLTVKTTTKDTADATVTGAFSATAKVEVAKVVDYTVMLSVDEDEDVPVIYSGVNVDNYGITDDSDHLSLEVTAEESFPGAWSMRKGFNFELPEGVYVTDVEVTDASDFFYELSGVTTEADTDDWTDAFWNAYIEGDHKGFEFEKRVFNDVDTDLYTDCATVTFQLELVADPGFVGDVNLKLTGDLVDEQEVTIAKFATPYIVKAEQNDLKIDYRYTDIPTDIVVTEAEAGLWDAGTAKIGFYFEDDLLTFEDDPTFTATGDLELKDDEIVKVDVTGDSDPEHVMMFTVDKESDEAATVTISDMQLYMSRSIPAGPYDLEMVTSMGAMYKQEVLFAPDEIGKVDVTDGLADVAGLSDPYVTRWSATPNPFASRPSKSAVEEDSYIDDVADFSTTAKEAFVNVVTAGREQDDASFTTKVVVPVGESYIVAGENQITLDVPAYVSAAGYTMLPVRAVATALGINNNNVIWNGESKTVTILYGQRIITMVAGQKTVNVNGSVIPASAAVEITDGRTFLPMRDLATALGVTDITWDAATKTATLNGGVQ